MALAPNVTGIEQISLENGSAPDILRLSAANILDLVQSADELLNTAFGDALSIVGDPGHQFTASEGSFTSLGTTTDADGRGMDVYEYSDGAAILAIVAVDQDLGTPTVA